ncbi:hypothetical protein FNU75_16465 [Proteus mirabilis]|nr:hypothetical protein [Escherichia coli]EBN0091606.1 hypothetical protein [Salmonella enterica subsp. enterica serovar Virchow]EBX1814605.1 hypothetical protein [Salmonella enterica subsp. enterica serovar Newport]ECA7109383.1 hypothetical protein [Salmonella enterica subsp. enterica serovar Infantis]ECG2669913.1 hypothetical protein [Salmonella enterica subsp. enterica serovar Takoradi]EIW8949813.1 hypothetical protein [Klebsiella pneumoniae]KAB7718686.1 hypothetical protein GBN12_00795 [P
MKAYSINHPCFHWKQCSKLNRCFHWKQCSKLNRCFHWKQCLKIGFFLSG